MEQIKINMTGLEFAQLAIDMSPAYVKGGA
jgi:hypothetical protein